MATFRKRVGSWRAEVCVKGVRSSITFTTKKEAQAWAAAEETRLREDKQGKIPNKLFRDLLDRYSREQSPKKRGGVREQKAITRLLRDDELADVPLRELSAKHIGEWRDRRLKQVCGATVNREWTILSAACTHARREWKWLTESPTRDAKRPKDSAARKRRPLLSETESMLHALGYQYDAPPKTKSSRIGAAFLFAIETAMRIGEICKLEWADFRSDKVVHLPEVKNDDPRDVPLSTEARRIIEQLRPVTGEGTTVFGLNTKTADALFRKAREKAMIEDLHFHDTRREALTRLSKIYDVMELARISGHHDIQTLYEVYYAPTAHDLAKKLA